MRKLSRFCTLAHIKPVLILPLIAVFCLLAVAVLWYAGPNTTAASGAVPETQQASEITSELFQPIGLPAAAAVNQADTTALVTILASSDDAVRNARTSRPDYGNAIREIRDATLQELERFILQHPASGWNPSLHCEVAARFREDGRITKSLSHWAEAWAIVGQAEGGYHKLLADMTLVHTASTLASLGRVEELEPLIVAYQFRVMSAPHLAQIWARTIEAFVTMRQQPEVAYRCGTFALDNVNRALWGRPLRNLWRVPSPATGFSLAALYSLAEEHDIGLIAAVRDQGAEIISPAVVHWKQNHYGAIKKFNGDEYLIADPTFPNSGWMSGSAIDEEASGFFLIPSRVQLPLGWRYATPEETLQVFGRGYPDVLDDDSTSGDCDPAEDPCCEPGPGAEGTGGDPCGMATWLVSEPNINLNVSDIPLSYKAAFGPDFVLKLAWRQRDTLAPLAARSHFGNGWNSPLIPVIIFDYRFVSGGLSERTIVLRWGDGLNYRIHFQNQATTSDTEFNGGMKAVRTVVGSTVTEVKIYFRNGSVERYVYPGGSYDYQLESRKDATGEAMIFSYDDPDSVGVSNRLSQVTLAHSSVFTFTYTNAADNFLITGVNGPNSRSASFGYSTISSTEVLTSITDAVGITSSFGYDTSRWWITSLVTPYGTNSFTLIDNSVAPSLTATGIERSIVISEPGGTKQAYVFYDNTSSPSEFAGVIPASFSAGQIPSYGGISDPPVQTLDEARDKWNSHYWNRQQAANLPSDLSTLTAADYRLSRTKHWLVQDHGYTINSLRSLGWILPPSANGTTEAQPTFYDYTGKVDLDYHIIGTESRPAVISRKMPDGTTWYKYFERNALGMVTSETERWEHNGVISYRTNETDYATGSDPSIAGLLIVAKRHNGVPVLGRLLHSTYPDQIGQETNAVGEVTTFDYDADRRLTNRLTHAGLLTTYEYDSTSGRLTNVIDAIVATPNNIPIRTNSFTWLNGYQRTHTDARNFKVTFDYDFLGRLLTNSYPDMTTETFEYFLPANTGFNTPSGSDLPILDLVTYTDRLGNKTRTLPNRNRQIEKILEPSKTNTGSFGTEHTIEYCGCGSPTAITRDSSGSPEQTELFYNYQGKVTGVKLPNSTWSTNYYDLLGRISIQDDALSSTTNIYDNLGRLVERRNGAGLIEGIQFDSDNMVLAMTNSSGVLITNLFDDIGRILKRGYPDGGLEIWTYTPGFSEPTQYQNQVTNVTTWAYDPAQRRTNEIGVGVYTNSFTYSPANDLVVLLDGKTNRTAWLYDQEGRLQVKTNQSNAKVLTNAYNANGQLTARWTPAKALTSYTYDKVGNLTFVNYPSGTSDITLGYNALSRLTSMQDGSGTSAFTYTTAGDLLTENGPHADDTITYTYHAGVPHLRTNLTLAQGSGGGTWSQTYAHDLARRISTITSPAGIFEYSYSSGVGSATNASQLWKKLALFTGSSTYITNVFDASARLTSTTLRNSSHTELNKHDYLYNLANQRTNQVRTGGGTNHYTYDPIGQLQSALGYLSGGAVDPTDTKGYKYDAAQNLNVRTNNGATTTFSVNVENELTGHTYDANGNATLLNSQTLTYDAENRLTQITGYNNSFRYDFAYDGFGRLRTRSTYAYSGGIWNFQTQIKYIYDGWTVIQERDYGGTPTVSYTRGTDLSGTLQGAGGIGGLLARSSGYSSGSWSTHHAYHADGGGNITALVNTSQTISANYRYDSFGNLITSSGSMASANTYRFSSKEWIPNADFYYYGYRFYSPNYQRWINQDPLGEAGGINLYRFVNNAPMSGIDSLGLACETPWDAFNVGLGLCSLGANASAGNIMGAFVDAGGILLDSAAAVTPFVPGGAGCAIRTGRAADKVNDWAKTSDKGRKVVDVPKDQLHRPYIRKPVRDEVNKRAPKNGDGKAIDPNTMMPINGKPDLGHKPGHEFWREKKKAEAEGLTQKEFNDRMNNPDLYQCEDPSSNRSRRHEQK